MKIWDMLWDRLDWDDDFLKSQFSWSIIYFIFLFCVALSKIVLMIGLFILATIMVITGIRMYQRNKVKKDEFSK